MSYVTSYYMSHVLGFKGKVYLIGSDGFAKQLALEGIPSVGHGPDVVPENISDIVSMTLDPEVWKCIVQDVSSCNGRGMHSLWVKLAYSTTFIIMKT